MEVRYHRIFRKKFKKLPDGIQRAFSERLILFKSNKTHPLLNNHDVSRAYPNSRSINITGDYRAFFYEDRTGAVFVNIGTHSELYG